MSVDASTSLFRNKLRSLTENAASVTSAAIFIAAEKIKALPQEEIAGCQTIRVAIAGSLTTSFMAQAIIYALGQEGICATVYESLYGSYVQEILDPASGLHRFKPDLLLIAPDWRDVVTGIPVASERDAAMGALAPKIALFENLWTAAETRLDCCIVQQTIVAPKWELCGLAERTTPSSEYWQVNALNEELIRRGRGRVTFLDLRILAESIGLKNWAPERLYIYGKLPFDSRYMPEYAQLFRAVWRGTAGREKKALVLDLDNTLWGGVIGDDGVDGIHIGESSMAGEAFAEWSRYILRLKQRGIVLAVCSKNDPAIARKGFDHPGSLLKLGDFVAFYCSWNDKAKGLKSIASDLNLGLNALVFCDDNPAECALVRQELPEVAVVELGEDPSDFIRRLETGCWFSRQNLTADDAARSASYAARRVMQEALENVTDIASFLGGLQMVGKIMRPTEAEMARVAQLESKTNQFNLLTPRFTEAEIRAFAEKPENLLYAVRLGDVHADHGLISCLIAVREGDAYTIKSWVMSCRVFSRGVEQFIMARFIDDARKAGAQKIVGTYRKTDKNGVIGDLLPRLGFHPTARDVWEFDLSADVELVNFIKAA